jgi:hypothetical protein
VERGVALRVAGVRVCAAIHTLYVCSATRLGHDALRDRGTCMWSVCCVCVECMYQSMPLLIIHIHISHIYTCMGIYIHTCTHACRRIGCSASECWVW